MTPAQLDEIEKRDKRCPPLSRSYLTSVENDRRSLIVALHESTAEVERLNTLVANLMLQAQSHACEAETANATIAEIYQVCSGATGEPGNWHGAEPVRRVVGQLAAANARIATLEDLGKRLTERVYALATKEPSHD